MANEKNLIPMSKRSKKEARDAGRKGGIASGEARRKKKSFAEAARWALEMETKANIGGNKEMITQYQAIILNLLSVANDKQNKQWIQAAQMLLQIEHGEASAERIRAETESIRAKTALMKGDGTARNGMLEELIAGLREDVHTETETADADVADGASETNQPS